MHAVSPPEPAGGAARTLLALRHALADPLSAATLKLDLVERRLGTPDGAAGPWIAERVRAVQVELSAASRLLDILLRLAEIAAEPQTETSMSVLSQNAGVALETPSAPIPSLLLRPRAAAEALQNVAAFAVRGHAGPPPTARPRLEQSEVVLTVEGLRVTADGNPGRLLDLPRGVEDADTLFLARAAVEADGGRLEIGESAGVLVARLSWPVPGAAREADA